MGDYASEPVAPQPGQAGWQMQMVSPAPTNPNLQPVMLPPVKLPPAVMTAAEFYGYGPGGNGGCSGNGGCGAYGGNGYGGNGGYGGYGGNGYGGCGGYGGNAYGGCGGCGYGPGPNSYGGPPGPGGRSGSPGPGGNCTGTGNFAPANVPANFSAGKGANFSPPNSPKRMATPGQMPMGPMQPSGGMQPSGAGPMQTPPRGRSPPRGCQTPPMDPAAYQMQVYRPNPNMAAMGPMAPNMAPNMPPGATMPNTVLAPPQNPMELLWRMQQAQGMRLDDLQGDMADIKKMLSMLMEKGGITPEQMKAMLAAAEVQRKGEEEALGAGPGGLGGKSFEAAGQALGPAPEDVDQAKRKRMELARQQARRKKDSLPAVPEGPQVRNSWMPREDPRSGGGVCGSCGNLFASDSIFCRKCGRRRDGQEVPSEDEDRQAKLQDVRQSFKAALGHMDGPEGYGPEGYGPESYGPESYGPGSFGPGRAGMAADPDDGYRSEFARDPFLSGQYEGYQYEAEDLHPAASARDPDPMMSIDFHPKPDINESLRRDAFTPGGGSIEDPQLSFGIPGQDPTGESLKSMSMNDSFTNFIKKDWNMEDKYFPSSSYDRDSAHHESISGSPIPELPSVRQVPVSKSRAEARNECATM
ncbi:unnamed protein product [Effrenium voratum]|nr:unnamed protein product [Effrenium voratum]